MKFTKPIFENILIIVLIILSLIFLFIFVNLIVNNSSKQNNTGVNANPQTTLNNTNFIKVLDCFNQPAESQQKCLDTFVENYANSNNKNTKALLAELESNRLTNSQLENSCHPVAHSIGRLAYKHEGNIGDAFEQCDYTCHSGCYHGVMERLFFTEAELADGTQHLTKSQLQSRVVGVCNKENFANPTNSIIFQCLHGLGHAILYYLDYDLVGSLETCGKLADTYEISSCSGGVFMENVTAFDKSKRDLKKNEPHYPCTKVSNEFKHDCYLMQTSVMFEYGLSADQIANECKNAGEYINTCLISLGRDISNNVRTGNMPYAVSTCSKISDKDGSYSCIDGLIYALIDNTWDAKFAYEYCDNLINDKKEHCYISSSNYLGSIYQKSPTDLESECNKYSKDKNYCISLINE